MPLVSHVLLSSSEKKFTSFIFLTQTWRSWGFSPISLKAFDKIPRWQKGIETHNTLRSVCIEVCVSVMVMCVDGLSVSRPPRCCLEQSKPISHDGWSATLFLPTRGALNKSAQENTFIRLMHRCEIHFFPLSQCFMIYCAAGMWNWVYPNKLFKWFRGWHWIFFLPQFMIYGYCKNMKLTIWV